MPSPDRIKEKLVQLPVLWGRPSMRIWDREDKVWEANEQGGHFHFFCTDGTPLWNPKTGDTIPAIGYTLSVTGTEKSKQAIAADFVLVLGEPRRNLRTAMREAFRGKNKIAYFDWLQPKDKTMKDDPSLMILAENPIEAFFLECVPRDDYHPRQLRNSRLLPSE